MLALVHMLPVQRHDKLLELVALFSDLLIIIETILWLTITTD